MNILNLLLARCGAMLMGNGGSLTPEQTGERVPIEVIRFRGRVPVGGVELESAVNDYTQIRTV